MKRPDLVVRLGIIAVLATVLAVAAGATGRQAIADQGVPQPSERIPRSPVIPISQSGDGAPGSSLTAKTGVAICATPTSGASNVSTDCEGIAPHNETSVSVHPTNALNVIEGANDYQLIVTGGTLYESIQSRAHVSFDAGQTWATYSLGEKNYDATGDPAVAFDAAGNAYYATLGFVFGQGFRTFTNPDIVVARSSDGGKTWASTRVASGSGSAGSVGKLNDKEYIAAWGDGNAIVTWSLFTDGIGGSYGGSPIYDAVTHDGGGTWSAPQKISGSAAFCVGFGGGTECNQSQDSYPVVAADGSVYIVFETVRDATTARDQYVVVQVDPVTGQRVAGPFKVGDFVDGATDTPFNVQGEPTLQDSQFRTFAFGNIAADPTNAGHLAAVWTDMRNSQLPAPSDPYQAETNSDVNVAQSLDRGRTWSSTVTLRIRNDQFQASGAFGADGLLRLGFFDRSYDAANHKYGYTIATETSAGSLHFSRDQLTTALSDPTRDDRWFSGLTVNPAFPHPSGFLGDYSNVAVGALAASWTDMRNTVQFGTRSGAGEDASSTERSERARSSHVYAPRRRTCSTSTTRATRSCSWTRTRTSRRRCNAGWSRTRSHSCSHRARSRCCSWTGSRRVCNCPRRSSSPSPRPSPASRETPSPT